MKYKKRNPSIEAVKNDWTPESLAEINRLTGNKYKTQHDLPGDLCGGDYLVIGLCGDTYVMQGKVFERIYKKAGKNKK